MINSKMLAAALSLLCFSAGTAVAAGSTTLTVGAAVTTGACIPLLDKSAVDLGTLRYSELNQNKPTTLSARSVALKITCSSPTGVAFVMADNAGLATALPEQFGLKGESAESVGYYTLQVGTAGSVVDNKAAYGVMAPVGTDDWVKAEGTSLSPADMASVATWQDTPDPFREAIINMALYAVINPASGITLTDDMTLSGSATLSLVYL